jgi:hypothetical protein
LAALVEDGLSTGAQAIAQAGFALKEIQRRGDYATTFEAHIREKFDLTRGRAYQLIYASEVIADLASVFESRQLPRSESAVRPMISLSREQRIEVWRRALEGAKRSPGHGTVKAIVQELVGIVPPDP